MSSCGYGHGVSQMGPCGYGHGVSLCLHVDTDTECLHVSMWICTWSFSISPYGLHIIIHMDLAPCLHIITCMDLAPWLHIITHMDLAPCLHTIIHNDLAPCLHIITHNDLAPCLHIIIHMDLVFSYISVTFVNIYQNITIQCAHM